VSAVDLGHLDAASSPRSTRRSTSNSRRPVLGRPLAAPVTSLPVSAVSSATKAPTNPEAASAWKHRPDMEYRQAAHFITMSVLYGSRKDIGFCSPDLKPIL